MTINWSDLVKSEEVLGKLRVFELDRYLAGGDLGGFLVSRNLPSKSHKLNSLALIGLLISHPASNNPNL